MPREAGSNLVQCQTRLAFCDTLYQHQHAHLAFLLRAHLACIRCDAVRCARLMQLVHVSHKDAFQGAFGLEDEIIAEKS
jgi:hypothetical protein